MVKDVTAENRLRTVYHGLQSQLRSSLQSSRSVIEHPGAKGQSTENNWLQMLQAHLPYRYQAEQAFVIDSQGNQSEQIDIVIYDRQYTPELYNSSGYKIIPSESVYAAFEVKQTLNKIHIEYAGQKISSVRNLHRTATNIIHAGGEHSPRELTRIIGGLLTTGSEWNPAFGAPFESSIGSLSKRSRIDIGCVANDGAFIFKNICDGRVFEKSSTDFSLAVFFLNLMKQLQSIGTVQAIDYDSYLKSFSE